MPNRLALASTPRWTADGSGRSAKPTIVDFGVTIGMQRLPAAQNRSQIRAVLLVGSVSGDKVEPDIYAATNRELR